MECSVTLECAALVSRVVSYCKTIQAALQGFHCLKLGISYFSPYLSALRWNFINYYCKNVHTMFLSELLEESLSALKHAMQLVSFAVLQKVHFGN
jgi:hypothetical protein